MSMKTRYAFCALLLALVLAGAGARSADVGFTFVNQASEAQAYRWLFLYPLLTNNAASGVGIITRDRVAKTNDGSGTVIVSNVLAGWVRGEFEGYYTKTTNWYYIPQTNGFVFATNYMVPPPYRGNGLLIEDGNSQGNRFLTEP
jgi:hypothetical protein